MEEMEKFCHTKKNMFLPIREGIAAAKKEIKKLSNSNEKHGSFLISMEYFFGLKVAKDKEKEEEARRAKRLASLVHKESQTDLEPEGRSTPDPRKRPREPTESPEDPANKKPEEKRPKEEAVWSCIRKEPSSGVEVSLTKKPFRGTRKAFVKMEDARALKLLKAAHIKIGWVSCRVRRKTDVKRCYRCLGFGHMAADCRGPDRSRSCWKCGEEGYTARTCLGEAANRSPSRQNRRRPRHAEAPIDSDPEVMLTRFQGHCLAKKQGSFEISGYCFGYVPHNVRK